MGSMTTLFCHESAKCHEQMISVEKRTKLRVISYSPSVTNRNTTIVFVGGLSTIPESFGSVIYELTRDYPFHYIETRDHASSQVNGSGKFDIITSGLDIVAIIQTLGLIHENYILIGYSMGVPVIVESYRFLKAKPRQMVFVVPTPVFHYPGWSLKLIKATLGFERITFRSFAKWYLRNFIINKRDDAEMVNISAKALDSADIVKLKKTVLAIAGYEIWNTLEVVHCPVLVLAATKDTFHIHDEILRIVSLLRNCHYIDLETNKRTHGVEAALLIREYIR